MLTTYAIYRDPSDFPPGSWVVRQWFVEGGKLPRPHDQHILCKSLEEARRCIPKGLIRTDPQPDEDPCIAEVWL